MALCALGGMGFGAVNELIEFFATLVLPDSRVGGYVNTGWDIFFNAVGAVVAVVSIRWSIRRRNREQGRCFARSISIPPRSKGPSLS
jgi:hypothetical protein